jgi:transposase
MKAYSMDLRQRVLADCDDGLTTSAVAAKYRVSPAWVRRLKQRRRQAGEVAPRQGRPGPAPKLAAHADRLRELVQRQPDLTPAEYRDQLGVACCPLTVWRALRRLGLTFKKKSSGPRSKAAPTWRPAGTSGPRR